ncbi:hypothetical protein [Streptomyces violaceusniger]|uniref:hypothetical protein n=1 Tax=Streptomyces violaceusniger TaxID=68280 RepID=UPI0010F90B07
MSQSTNPLARDLEEAVADLGAALGAALTALDNPAVAIAQLTKLVAVAKATAKGRDIELASHWRMADVLLAAKTTNPADDAPAGGDE